MSEENRKLIDWVQKILEQFGTFNVSSREGIHIPIMMKKIGRWGDGIDNETATTETIIIPEIVISKTTYR